MKIKKTTITELLIKWCPWLLMTLLFCSAVFIHIELYAYLIGVFFCTFFMAYPLYLALLCTYYKNTFKKGIFIIFSLMSHYCVFILACIIISIMYTLLSKTSWLLFNEQGYILIYLLLGFFVIIAQFLLAIFWFSILHFISYLFRKAQRNTVTTKEISTEKAKKVILISLKILPLVIIIAFQFILQLNISKTAYSFLGSIMLFNVIIYPIYLLFLNSLEENPRFFRSLLEMGLFLSPYLVLFIDKSSLTKALAPIYCIYVYAAMIISWTLFYFIRKFYDKKYKAKAVEAEN